MLETIVAALKAIPMLVEAINQLGKLYHQVQIEMVEKRFEEIRREVDVITAELADNTRTRTNEERAEIIKRLNRAVSK